MYVGNCPPASVTNNIECFNAGDVSALPTPRADTCTTSPSYGQYVYIYKAGSSIRLSLCEVEVFGTAGTLFLPVPLTRLGFCC